MTAPRPDTSLPIDVQGEVILDGPSGRELRLTAEGDRLSLAATGWASLGGLGPRSLLAQRRALARAIRALKTLHLTLDVNVDGQRAFGLGNGVKATPLARLLGLDSVDLRLRNLVSLLRMRAATPHAGPR